MLYLNSEWTHGASETHAPGTMNIFTLGFICTCFYATRTSELQVTSRFCHITLRFALMLTSPFLVFNSSLMFLIMWPGVSPLHRLYENTALWMDLRSVLQIQHQEKPPSAVARESVHWRSIRIRKLYWPCRKLLIWWKTYVELSYAGYLGFLTELVYREHFVLIWLICSKSVKCVEYVVSVDFFF